MMFNERISRAIKKGLEERAESPGWRPIESAPQEAGPWILVWDSESEIQRLVTWINGWKEFMGTDGTVFGDDQLTHWMPLPSPPEEQA